jgi:hypothetical protein
MVTFCNVSGEWGVRVEGGSVAFARPNARMTATKRSGETTDVVLVAKQETGVRRGQPFEVWTIADTRRVSAYRGGRRSPATAYDLAEPEAPRDPGVLPEPAPTPPQPTTAPELFAWLLAKPVAEDVAFRIARDQNGADEARVGVSW